MEEKQNITLPGGQVISTTDPSYDEYAKQQNIATTPITTPTTTPIATPTTQTTPVVPGVIPQSDFTTATSPEDSAKITQEAKSKISFTPEQDSELNIAYQREVKGAQTETDIKNLTYARGKGWQPTIKTEPATKMEEIAKSVETQPQSTADRIYDLMSNIGNLKAEAKAQAMKDQDIEGKSLALSEAQSFANILRTKIQNEGILDIKEQDLIRSKPILNSQIQGQLSDLSREQKLDAMILQNNYNNALVEVQIAEGNYDRAREIVKEVANDAYENSILQLESLRFKQEIEDKEYERMREDLQYERGLAMDGYVHIKSPEGLKGLTEDKIFRDPVSGKIYLKPTPEVVSTMEINGTTYGFDKYGNKIATYGKTRDDSLSISDQMKLLESGYRVNPETGKVEINPTSASAQQIANAIKQVESGGNYNASGASGEFGAYQFMPETWESWSKEYASSRGISLMPEGLAKTESNQDAVAMFKINQWLSQGLSPEQIAAKWNSGSEFGWENKIGVNQYGVSYNVPDYVNKVTSALQSQLQSGLGGKISEFTRLNAANLVSSTLGARAVSNTDLVDAVAVMLSQGISKDEIVDQMRYSEQSLDYGQWRSIANSVLTSVPATKRKSIEDGLDDFIQNGDIAGARDYVLKVARDTAIADEKKNVTGREEALYAINIIENELDNFIQAGGNTGLLSGNVEKFSQNVLKKTKDPMLAEIANTISQTIQTYRQQLTGAAFTESEGREYNRLFPSITKSPELNQALINSLKSQYERNMRLFYERQLGKTGYNKLEELTGEPIVGVGDLGRFNNTNNNSYQTQTNNFLSSIGY